MVSSTPMAAEMASPYRKPMPSSSMPSRAMQTTTPAKSTARPDVFTAVTMEASVSWPARSPWRCRLTMNSA